MDVVLFGVGEVEGYVGLVFVCGWLGVPGEGKFFGGWEGFFEVVAGFFCVGVDDFDVSGDWCFAEHSDGCCCGKGCFRVAGDFDL